MSVLKWSVYAGSFFALFFCFLTIMAMERMIIFTDYIYGNIYNSSFSINLLTQKEAEFSSNNTLKLDITHPFDMCVLPKFDPWDQDIIPFVNLNYNPLKTCNRNFIPMTTLKNGILSSTTENYTCWGRCLGRVSDKENSQGRWVNISEADFRCDIVKSMCNNTSGDHVYQMLHAQIIERTTKKKPSKSVNGSQYSVYVILIDSMSSSQGIRNLPRTMQYFEKSMQAVTFPYINKVGLNSRPNGVALWFGKLMEKVDRSLYGLPLLKNEWDYDNFCHRFLDNETFLMKEFADYGYKTLLAEDWMKGTLNWPNCKGFNKQPTDHYMRPFQIAIEKSPPPILKKTYSTANCIEQHQDILRYLAEFVKSYNGIPKFGWIWLSLLSHDHESGIIHADGDFHEFLLKNREKLDESFVIILGDHGLRGGKVTRTKLGELEMSNPLFSISVPRSLRHGNDIISILRENAARLQTHFDIRTTLLDILKYQPSSNYTDRHYRSIDKEYGSSLLRRQGIGERTCKNLPIPTAYCICQYAVDELNTTSEMAHNIGEFVLQYINRHLSDKNMTDKCQTLLYNRTIHLSVYLPANLTNTYQIVVKANEPSNGEFKALVRRTAEDSFTMASTTIERMDRFGNHGICATDGLKHLCYCMNNATTMTNSLSTVQPTHHLRVQTSSQISLTNKTYS